MLNVNETEILFSLIKTRFGNRVTSEELEEIRKGLITILESVTAMRAVNLENWDEPYQFFKPLGDDEP